jgi:hypothetical protein
MHSASSDSISSERELSSLLRDCAASPSTALTEVVEHRYIGFKQRRLAQTPGPGYHDPVVQVAGLTSPKRPLLFSPDLAVPPAAQGKSV